MVLSASSVRLNAKARLSPGLIFSIYFYFTELGGTKLPILASLFLACRSFILFGLLSLGVDFFRILCLTCEFGGFLRRLICMLLDYGRIAALREKSKGNNSVASPFGLRSSLRQSGRPLRRWARRGAEAPLYLDATAKATALCLVEHFRSHPSPGSRRMGADESCIRG
jgi:hypothetical protein